MRKHLEKLDEQRLTFEATFERYGTKHGYKGGTIATLLFTGVKTGGRHVSDHIWFTTNKRFDSMRLQKGQIILFEARVKSYRKGYRGWRKDVFDLQEQDYKLSHPTKIRLISDLS